MRNIFVLILAILLFGQVLNAQIIDAKDLPLRIQDNAGSNGWSPDGKLFATYTRSEEKTRLWTLKDETVIWEISLGNNQEENEKLNAQTFIWSKNQDHLLVKDERGEIYLLNPLNGKVIWKNKIKDNVEIIQFNPNEEQIVLVFSEKNEKAKIEFWDVETGKLENLFISDVNFFDYFSFDENSKVLKFGNFEGKAILINSENGKFIKNITLKPCSNLKDKFSQKTAFSPNLTYLVARCDDKTVITNVKTEKVLRILDMRTDFEKTIGFSGDEKVMILEDLGYKVFNFANDSVKDIEDPDLWFYVDLNYDGSLFLHNTDYRDRGYEVIEVQTGKVIKNFENHPGEIKSLVFNDDGSLFASGSTDTILRIWDTQTKKILFALAGHTDAINLIKFSNEDKSVTSKSENETIVWDVENGEKLSEEKTGTKDTEELKEKVFSPNGKYVLEDMGDEKPFQLKDLESGNVVQEFSGLTQIQGFKFTPDGERFLSAAYFQPLQLWNIKNGKKSQDFDIGYSHDNIIAFSPNGKTFITGGENQNILMYELETGKLIWSLFPIDQEEMQAERRDEAKRIKYLQDKSDYEKRADLDNEKRVKKITVKFSHYGDAESFWDQKIAESGEPNRSKLKKSKDKATVAWFTLTNDADLPVTIDTNSMYLNPKCKGLCEGAEISSRYVLEFKNGETNVNGFDMYSSTILPPQTTVYFSVSLEHIEASKAIYLGYTFQKDNPDDDHSNDYGTEQKVYLNIADLL